jgi:hypothetical protein
VIRTLNKDTNKLDGRIVIAFALFGGDTWLSDACGEDPGGEPVDPAGVGVGCSGDRDVEDGGEADGASAGEFSNGTGEPVGAIDDSGDGVGAEEVGEGGDDDGAPAGELADGTGEPIGAVDDAGEGGDDDGAPAGDIVGDPVGDS